MFKQKEFITLISGKTFIPNIADNRCYITKDKNNFDPSGGGIIDPSIS